MVDYDYTPISDESVREESVPFEFSNDERSSLREIKVALGNESSYEQLTDYREYLEGLIEKVHSAVLNAKEMKYETTDLEIDLNFLRDLQIKVIKRQHDEM